MSRKDVIISYLYELLYLPVFAVMGLRFVWPFVAEFDPETIEAFENLSEKQLSIISGGKYVFVIFWICLISFVAVKILVSNIVTKLFFLVCVSSVQIAFMVLRINLDKMIVDMGYVLIFMLLLETVNYFWTREGKKEERAHMVYLMPLVFVMFLVLWYVPAPEKPVDWSPVKNLYTSVVKSGKKFVSKLENIGSIGYGEGEAGFGDSAKLFGKVGSENTEVMYVSGTAMNHGPVYLGGKTFDYFTGREWEKRIEGDDYAKALDTIEFLTAARNNYAESLTDIYKAVSVQVRYNDINSKYMFAPSKTLLDSTVTRPGFPENVGTDIIWNKNHGFDTNYSLTCYVLNDNAKVLALEPQEIERSRFESMSKTADLARLVGDSDRFELFEEYRENIYKTYLSDINVSAETRTLIDKILEGADTDYEKLERIAAYLAMGDYTMTPGELGKEIKTSGEYLDYFLCKHTSGYCSYYATAFVLMARLEGIPARYVQGYRVPKNLSETYTVQSKDAHAWPEAYIENVGWLVFEPTPGFYEEVTWETVRERDERQALEDAEREALLENSEPDTVFEEDVLEIMANQSKEEPKKEINFLGGLAIFVVIAVLMALITILAVILIKFNRFRHLKEREKVIAICRKNILMLTCLGYPLENGETLSEYRKRLETVYPSDNLSFLVDYEKVLYARNAYRGRMLSDADKCGRKLKASLKENKQMIKYWLRVYSG